MWEFCAESDLMTKPRFWFLIPVKIPLDEIHVPRCFGLQPRRIRLWYFQGCECERLFVLCIVSYGWTWWEPDSDSLFLSKHHQMKSMFKNAEAFNQDLSNFDTSSANNVRVYICAESNLTRNQILIIHIPTHLTHLLIRWAACSEMRRPSIRTCAILETIGRTTMMQICLKTLDA